MEYWEINPKSWTKANPRIQYPSYSGLVRRTYKLTPELICRLNATCSELRVYPSELVRFLLSRALDQIEAGDLQVPTKPAYRHIIAESGPDIPEELGTDE